MVGEGEICAPNQVTQKSPDCGQGNDRNGGVTERRVWGPRWKLLSYGWAGGFLEEGTFMLPVEANIHSDLTTNRP